MLRDALARRAVLWAIQCIMGNTDSLFLYYVLYVLLLYYYLLCIMYSWTLFSTQAGRGNVGGAERVGSMSIQPIVPDAPLAARAGCGDRRHCRGPSETASRRHPVDDGSCPAHRLFGGFRRAASNAQPRLPATCNGPCSPAPAPRLALWCSRLPPTSFQASTRLLRPSSGGSRLGAVRRAATPRTSRR